METVILAGGLGTRLRSRLEGQPKVLATVAGRPFLAILLDRLISANCARVLLSVGYLRDAIIQQFQYEYRGMELVYVVEEAPLGTGGAIRTALARCREDSVLVLNGDTFVDLDYITMADFHRFESRPITIALVEVQDAGRFGRVLIEHRTVVGFEEKVNSGVGGWINAGAYILNRSFRWPSEIGRQFSFEREVLCPSVKSLRPAAFKHVGFFLDIGVPADLDRAQIELRNYA